jgi:4-hydroxy-3-methylbut-2-enyl diphosphate reductase
VTGEAPDDVYLVETEVDLDTIPDAIRTAPRLAVTTQTTLSQWDTERLITQMRARFPQIEVYNEICQATQLRQEAVARMARGAELTIVVGDPRSNNTNRLVQVAEELAGSPAIRIERLDDLKPEMLEGRRRVAVTSGASTPSQLTREVIRFVERYGAKARHLSGAELEEVAGGEAEHADHGTQPAEHRHTPEDQSPGDQPFAG